METYKQTVELDVPVGFYLKNIHLRQIDNKCNEYYFGVKLAGKECTLTCSAEIHPIVKNPDPEPFKTLPIGVRAKISNKTWDEDEYVIGYKSSLSCFIVTQVSNSMYLSKDCIGRIYNNIDFDSHDWLPLDE